MLGFMTRPVMDNFKPFAVENLPAIRALRLTDLSDPDKSMRRQKSRSPAAKGPRLDKRTKAVLDGLDPATRKILEAMMGKK